MLSPMNVAPDIPTPPATTSAPVLILVLTVVSSIIT